MRRSSTVWVLSLGILVGSTACGETSNGDAPENSAGQGGNVAGAGTGQESGGEPTFGGRDASTGGLTGAGGFEGGRRCEGDAGSGVGGVSGTGATATRIVLGCREEPLALGPASRLDRAPQIVSSGPDLSDFAVGWVTPDGYKIRKTNGLSISNTLDLSEMPETADPQLFWTGSELELYYALEDSVYVDTVTNDEGPLAVVKTELVGTGRGFRAVMTEPGKVAVVTNDALFLDGKRVESRVFSIGELGWNGQYFLLSAVLGHGAWNLTRLDTDGRTLTSPIDLQWSGIDGTGRGAGSYFASSPSTGRHAIVVAASGELTFAVEGAPIFERPMLEKDADVSVFWNGEYYLVLLANGQVLPRGAQRDIALLAFTKDGTLVSDTPVPISEHSADERFPVGAAIDKSTFGAAWIRNGELVVQRCSVVFR